MSDIELAALGGFAVGLASGYLLVRSVTEAHLDQAMDHLKQASGFLDQSKQLDESAARSREASDRILDEAERQHAAAKAIAARAEELLGAYRGDPR